MRGSAFVVCSLVLAVVPALMPSVAASQTIDLVADSLSVEPTTVEAGDAVEVDWAGSVAGTGAVTVPVFIGFFLSADRTITTDDLSLAQETVVSGGQPGDTFGESSPGTMMTIPDGVPDGTYYLGMLVDATFDVAEIDETNNTVSAEIVVASGGTSPGVTRWLVPAAASAPGFGSSNWKTQISIVNPHRSARTASLYFVENGAPWPGVLLAGPSVVAGTDRAYFDDVLAGLNPTSGLLWVELDQPGPVVTSRTYNLESGGATFGQGIPAIPFAGIDPPDEVVLPMVHTEPDRFHTNLGLVQTETETLQVRVQVYNAVGVLIGTRSYSQAAAWQQINDLFADMGLGNQIIYGGWLRLTRTGGSGFWTCYASVVDDVTDDPTYVAPMEVVPED